MSVVNNYVLLLHRDDDETFDMFNVFLKEERGHWFEKVEQPSGPKNMEASAYVMGAKAVGPEELSEYIRKIDWEAPYHLILMVCEEEDEFWRPYPVFADSYLQITNDE